MEAPFDGLLREVETRVNVWTVRQKKGSCRVVTFVKRGPLVGVRFYTYFTPFSHPERRSRRSKPMTTIELFQSIDSLDLTSVKPASSMRASWKACSGNNR